MASKAKGKMVSKKAWHQSVTIRAAIIGAVLVGTFSLIVVLIPILQKQPKITTSIVIDGFNTEKPYGQGISYGCPVKIRLFNVSDTSTILKEIIATVYINNELKTILWQNEMIGSGDSIDGLTVYLDLQNKSPVTIEAHSYADVDVIFYVDSYTGNYEYLSPEEHDKYPDIQHQSVSVQYSFEFPDIKGVKTEPIYCVDVVRINK